jgi:hypothetical protein
MGPIQDRTRENLVSTDNGIIMVRHRLMKAARALTEKGVPPPGLDPQSQQVRSVAIVLQRDLPFSEGAKDALHAEAGKAHTTI